ncbi:MAG: DUF2012 domain-containing protein [Nitrospirae bacterium]|nr:DUF2012 domain-containing protein [Nitrospirota bacterium]
MRSFRITGLMLLSLLFLNACPGKKDGAVEGQVSPPGAGIRIVALLQGKTLAQTDAGTQDGRFRIALPAGTYEIKVTAPSSPYPLTLSGIVVKSGETTSLAPISLAVPKGTGSITGKVLAAGTGTHIVLLAEGIERAAVNTSVDGKYEFEGLPAGRYTLQVSSPGYANDSITVGVSDDRRTSQDIRMLYITAIEGIDWSTGKARARGIGLPPKQAPTPTIRREMAKRAAVVDAERNLLRIVELINVGPGQKLTESLGEGTFAQKLQGFLQGYRIAAERDMDGGKVEVELELPLTGVGGLSSSLQP